MTDSKKLRYGRGALFALGGPIIGIILWLVVWQLEFIASIVAFAMAWLTVWLYRKGAGGIDKQSLKVIIPYVVVGVIAAFYATFTADTLAYLQSNEAKGTSTLDLLTTADFWRFNHDNLTDSSVLGQYTGDIIFTFLLGGLGIFSTLKDTFKEAKSEPESASETKTSK